MRKTQHLFYLLINFVIIIYAEDEQLTKDFELSKSSCMDIYKYFESTDVGYYFECKKDKTPNKFVLSIGHSQQFNKVTFKMKFLVSENIEKDNFKILIDNFNIQEFEMVKEGEKSYQIQVSQTDAKGSIQLDIKQDKQNAEFKVSKATLSLLIKNYDKYKDNRQCQKCNSQYFLDQMTGLCSDYQTNCQILENKKCKKCNNGYLLNNFGFYQCPTGFYSDNDKFCQKCGAFCTFCHSNDTCLQREEKRYFQDGVCRENFSDGQFVSAQESTNGQLICEQCDESCLTCTGPSQNECVTCSEDLILYLSNSCLQQCPEGYFKKSNNSSENIKKSKNSPYYCAKYYYLDQKCLEQCPFQTFLLENNVCKTCSTKNCADCSTNDICNICQNEFIFNEKNQCVKCNQNTYYDAQKKDCKICPDANCLDCCSEQNGKVCKKCKQYYQFHVDKLLCQFNDTEYLLECSNPSNCRKEQDIVKASDATISIISISNTVLLLFSFAFFPIGPFFLILSLGPTVIQNFYQHNIFPLFPDSTFNTYDETNLLYARSSQLSIMSAFRSQPLKKYFINNMAYFFIFLFIVILIYCVSKCINRKYIRILDKQQVQNKLKVKERYCYPDNNIFDNSQNLNIICSLHQNTQKMNKTQNQVNQIGQNLLIKNENQIQKQNEKRLNLFSENQSFLKLIEYNLFIRFQMVFGNYFLLCLLYSVSKLSLNSTFDYVDLGVKSFFSLIYIIFVFLLSYKMSTFDELNFTQDCSKFKVVFSNIETNGLKKYFWIFLECENKVIDTTLMRFDQGQGFKNSRFFNDLTNSDIDYYSKQWGINPTFAKKIYQEAQEEFRKKYEQEEIRAQQQLELKEQSKQKVVENKLQSQKSSTFTQKEVHGTIKQKKSCKNKGNIFAQEQSQNKTRFNPNNQQQIQQHSSIIQLQNTSQKIFEQSTGSSTLQQKLIKLNKFQNNNQSSQEQLQKELFPSNYDSH
ncbi:hypothetical protein ABPG72_020520 [Tetrahymena utriculariae]